MLLPSDCSNSVDLALVLDMSGSTDDSHDMVLQMARRLVDRLNLKSPIYGGGSRVALVTYAASATVWFSLGTYNDETALLEAFNIITPSEEGTYTRSALTLMQKDVFNASRGDRSGVANVAVIITDGRSNIQQDETVSAAAAARSAGTTIYVVGVSDVNEVELTGIAGTVTNYWRATNEQLASDAINSIAERLCTPWF